jgi:hypothetical protein
MGMYDGAFFRTGEMALIMSTRYEPPMSPPGARIYMAWDFQALLELSDASNRDCGEDERRC